MLKCLSQLDDFLYLLFQSQCVDWWTVPLSRRLTLFCNDLSFFVTSLVYPDLYSIVSELEKCLAAPIIIIVEGKKNPFLEI